MRPIFITFPVSGFKNNPYVPWSKDALERHMQGEDYDTAAHRWLTVNQKKYGYKYSKA